MNDGLLFETWERSDTYYHAGQIFSLTLTYLRGQKMHMLLTHMTLSRQRIFFPNILLFHINTSEPQPLL